MPRRCRVAGAGRSERVQRRRRVAGAAGAGRARQPRAADGPTTQRVHAAPDTARQGTLL